MAVDTNPAKSTFLEKLKLEEESDPCWLPSRPWESIPSESGPRPSSPPPPPHRHDSTSSVSESSLVRLAMNALHGSESALIAIEEFYMLFSSDSADRTSHKIPSLWIPALSTLALGNLLKYFGHFGCIVFLLRKFVDYFTSSSCSGTHELREQQCDGSDDLELRPDKQTLVNHAFAVALRNVLDAYISSLNTLHASVSFRRSSKASHGGFHSSVGHSDITLLEVHLHSTSLRNQIEALGSICNIHDIALSFSDSPFRSLSVKASLEFNNYPRGGNLLTFLYKQLKVGDPVHNSITKYLFLQSLEPYCAFIRSWIFEGQICDPYNEFVVEYIDQTPGHKHGEAASTFSLATAKVRDGVAIPCFLEELLIPLFRAGQQLQVLMRLLELYNVLGACFASREEILPHLKVFGSPLSFDKRTIESWVVERNNYYQRMLERVESFLDKFKFKAQQGSPYDIEFAHTKHRSILDLPDHTVEEALISLSDGADQNSYGNLKTENSETSSTTDEFCYGDDSWDLSESESLVCSNERSESEPMHENCSGDTALRQTWLSALDFNFQSYNSSLRDCARSADLNKLKSMPSTTFEEKDTPYNGLDASPKAPSDTFLLNDANVETQMHQYDACSIFGVLQNYVQAEAQGSDNLFLHNVGHGLRVTNKKLDITLADMSNWGDSTFHANSFVAKGNSESGHYPDKLCDSSSLLSLLSKKLIKHPNFFSMNPIFLKRYIMDSGGNHRPSSGPLFPRYDFTTVKDPSKMCVERLSASTTLPTGPVFLDTLKPDATVYINKPVCGKEKNEDTKPLRLDAKAGENLPLADVSGGGGWESLLRGFCKVNDLSSMDSKTNTLVAFEIPLDFVIKKCMWEEISLQYRYVSNLTIKFLQEGFDLQEHLLALRRYHFMEVADWADLFIMSLWNHKYMTEADKRIPEIQGVLELSVRRSSCEGDTNKNRLYLYIKGHCMSSLPTLSTGIHSFDHLGLGYRVDWPVSIILTPEALKTYSEIFNFLIQIKLGAFFLTDSWCSLKKLVQLTKAIRRSDLQKEIVSSISILLDTRHQVNHFVLTLQQYVQSQLSDVSWCRLLHSLKNKVKDMMDLESVHYQYLAESLHLCFLSDVTQPISTIIQSMLQCALDFRSCLIESSSETGLDKVAKEALLSKLSQVDIHKVLLIKSTVVKNVKDLYMLYLKSPKHGESGVSRFWDCLNYNEYYSELITKEVGHHTFSV